MSGRTLILLPGLLAGAAACVMSAACASAGKPAARTTADPGETRPSAMVKVEALFLPDPARIAPALRDDQDFMPPHPIVTHLPKYPDGHEDAAGPVVVVLRFVVGEKGAVRDVRDSPLRDAGPAADPAFRESAVDAVLSWLFVPAAIRTLKPGPDLDHDSKPDYTVLIDSERIPVYMDVRFTFERIDGEGRVRID